MQPYDGYFNDFIKIKNSYQHERNFNSQDEATIVPI